MVKDRYGCEQGFLPASETFYKKLSGYIMTRVIKDRLTKACGGNVGNVFHHHLNRIIDSGKDVNTVRIAMEKHGHLPFPQILQRMDVTVAARALLTDVEIPGKTVSLLKSEAEWECISKLRLERNDLIHDVDYGADQDAFDHACWKASVPYMEQAGQLFASCLEADTKAQIQNYCSGRSNFTKPAETVEERFAQLMKQDANFALNHLLENNQASKLTNYVRNYKTEIYTYAVARSTPLQHRKTIAYWLWDKDGDFAILHGEFLAGKEKTDFLQKCVRRYSNDGRLVGYFNKELGKDCTDPVQQRRYFRLALAADPTNKWYCQQDLAGHHSDLDAVPEHIWLQGRKEYDAVIALMPQAEQAHFYKKEKAAFRNRWITIGDLPLDERPEEIRKLPGRSTRPACKEAAAELVAELSEGYWEDQLAYLQRVEQLPYPQNEKYTVAIPGGVLTDSEAFRLWNSRYEAFLAERERQKAEARERELLALAESTERIAEEYKQIAAATVAICRENEKKLASVLKMPTGEKKRIALEELLRIYGSQHTRCGACYRDGQRQLCLLSNREEYKAQYASRQQALDQVKEAEQKLSQTLNRIQSEIKRTEEKRTLQKKRRRIGKRAMVVFAAVAVVAAAIAGFCVFSLQRAVDLWEQGQLVGAYRIYDRFSRVFDSAEQQRILCLADIRQQMQENGFRQDTLITDFEEEVPQELIDEWSLYQTTDAALVYSDNLPVCRQEDGTYLIPIGSRRGPLHIPAGKELRAVWAMTRESGKLWVGAICTDGTLLDGELKWETHPKVVQAVEAELSEIGMQMQGLSNLGDIKQVLLLPGGRYIWLEDGRIFDSQGTHLFTARNIAYDANGELKAVGDDGGWLPNPYRVSLPNDLQLDDIVDYWSSNCYITQAGLMMEGDWAEENDWLFYEADGAALSVYDEAVARWLN